jgi:hypothetical protein
MGGPFDLHAKPLISLPEVPQVPDRAWAEPAWRVRRDNAQGENRIEVLGTGGHATKRKG